MCELPRRIQGIVTMSKGNFEANFYPKPESTEGHGWTA